MTDLTQRLRDATEGTTPGPWNLCAHLANDHENGCTCGYRGVIYAADTEYAICQPGHDVTPGEEGLEPPRRPRAEEVANARFIAAARQLVPEAAARIEALEAEVARLRGAVQKADDHLTNLQPHIPQACYPGHEGFIDSHVDCAQEVLRAALTPPHVQHTAGVVGQG